MVVHPVQRPLLWDLFLENFVGSSHPRKNPFTFNHCSPLYKTYCSEHFGGDIITLNTRAPARILWYNFINKQTASRMSPAFSSKLNGDCQDKSQKIAPSATEWDRSRMRRESLSDEELLMEERPWGTMGLSLSFLAHGASSQHVFLPHWTFLMNYEINFRM